MTVNFNCATVVEGVWMVVESGDDPGPNDEPPREVRCFAYIVLYAV